MSAVVKAIEKKDLIVVSASITRPANTTVYTTGDAVSEVTTNNYFTFTRALKAGTRHGKILRAHLTSVANGIAGGMDCSLWLFHTVIAETADNANWAPTDAEIVTRIGKIDFPAASWNIRAINANCDVAVDLPFQRGALVSSEVTLFGQLVVNSAYTPVSGEIITAELVISQW